MDRVKLTAQLIESERLKLRPYRDSEGKLTIGVGRNLDDVGIGEDEALYLLSNDIKRAENLVGEYLPWVLDLDDVRQRVVIDMMFNMGWKSRDGKHGLSTFRDTLEAIRSGRYDEAAAGMLASVWAGQVGKRADHLAAMMRTGMDAA